MEFSKNKCKLVKCLKKLSKCSIFSFRLDPESLLLYLNFEEIEYYGLISCKIIQSKMQVHLKNQIEMAWNTVAHKLRLV